MNLNLTLITNKKGDIKLTNDYEVIGLDLYQECIEPLDADTQKKMLAGKETSAYEHACQWTTIYPNSYS